MKVLVINAGSSSLKFQLIDSNNWKILYKGHIDGINQKTCQYIEEFNQNQKSKKIKCANHTEAVKIGIKALQQSKIIKNLKEITAIGHRVVHGGEKYYKPTLINQTVINTIKKLSELAPLHNPPNLEGILACQKLLPKIPNIAVFDTAFHHTIPEKAYLYAIPYEFYKKYQIRKYGFHGTSHQYISEKAIKYLKLNKLPYSKIITCHLGNGGSITAIKNGKSIDTSMGFTPLEGIPMGTRCGDIDPAIFFYLIDQKKLSPHKIDSILNKESGLLGLSGLSRDVRKLRDLWFKEKSKKAKLALDVYCYRITKYIGNYQIALGGLDCLIFTAGIGENAWYIRKWVCDYLKFLGLKLDDKKNKINSCEISNSKSKIKVLVIPTNEEGKIAMETTKMIL